MNKKTGKVYLVGAGPGDPELMTRKAYRLVQQADVILYDRLVNTDMLEDIKDGCQLVYVGKKEGLHVIPQEEINRLLRDYALRYPLVVRLKGGDPFLFGRGGEEALYLREYGIPFEIVPGVTSALGAPAYAGIPVTHRGMASMCSMITGHLAKEEVDDLPWDALAVMQTLIFMMAVGARQYIAQQLLAHGRPEEEPVAFIEHGTTSKQRVTRTTLGVLARTPPAVRSPAILLVGEVARLHEELDWFSAASDLPHLPGLEVMEVGDQGVVLADTRGQGEGEKQESEVLP